LKPGNPDGTYTQEIPLAGIKSEPTMSFIVGDKTTDLKYRDDFIRVISAVSNRKSRSTVRIVVFCRIRRRRARNMAGRITKTFDVHGKNAADADRRSPNFRSEKIHQKLDEKMF